MRSVEVRAHRRPYRSFRVLRLAARTERALGWRLEARFSDSWSSKNSFKKVVTSPLFVTRREIIQNALHSVRKFVLLIDLAKGRTKKICFCGRGFCRFQMFHMSI